MEALGPRQLERLRGVAARLGRFSPYTGGKETDHGQGTTRRTTAALAKGRTAGGGEPSIEEAHPPGGQCRCHGCRIANGGTWVSGNAGWRGIVHRWRRSGTGSGGRRGKSWCAPQAQSRGTAEPAGARTGQPGLARAGDELRLPLCAIRSPLDRGHDGSGDRRGAGVVGGDSALG